MKKMTKLKTKNNRLDIKSKKNSYKKITKISSANKKKAPKSIAKSAHQKPKARH